MCLLVSKIHIFAVIPDHIPGSLNTMNADCKESLARGAHSPHECYTVIREHFALQIFCTLNFRVNNAHIVNNVHNFRALNFRTGHAVSKIF